MWPSVRGIREARAQDHLGQRQKERKGGQIHSAHLFATFPRWTSV